MMKNALLLVFVLWVFACFVPAQEPALFPVEKNGKAGYIEKQVTLIKKEKLLFL